MDCPKNVDMIVWPQTENGQVKWQMQDCVTGKSGGHNDYPELSVPWSTVSTAPHFTFQIVNGQGWQFAKDAAALWVSSGSQDPTKASTDWHVPAGSIHTSNPSPPDPSTDNTKLDFTDINHQQPATLHYTLNFVNGAQKSSTLDPIIDNGGCCKGLGHPVDFTSTSFLAGAAVGFILAIVLALIIVRYRRNTNPS